MSWVQERSKVDDFIDKLTDLCEEQAANRNTTERIRSHCLSFCDWLLELYLADEQRKYASSLEDLQDLTKPISEEELKTAIRNIGKANRMPSKKDALRSLIISRSNIVQATAYQDIFELTLEIGSTLLFEEVCTIDELNVEVDRYINERLLRG